VIEIKIKEKEIINIRLIGYFKGPKKESMIKGPMFLQDHLTSLSFLRTYRTII
jgi:hypothetical protein